LRIVDFDLVEASNLDRQFYFADQVGRTKVEALRENLLRINPRLMIETENLKIEKATVGSLFAGCPIVAECLDQPDDKGMLVSTLCHGHLHCAASAWAFRRGDASGYIVSEQPVVIGDLQSDIADQPALAPRVNIVAAKQATHLDYVLHARLMNSPLRAWERRFFTGHRDRALSESGPDGAKFFVVH
jgi:sulfur carrier protein ThiS adenylyltransferase